MLFRSDKATTIQLQITTHATTQHMHPRQDIKVLRNSYTTPTPRGGEAVLDKRWTPRRRLQEGNDPRVPPPPDPKIRVFTRSNMEDEGSGFPRTPLSSAWPKPYKVFTRQTHSTSDVWCIQAGAPPPLSAKHQSPRRSHGHGSQPAPEP